MKQRCSHLIAILLVQMFSLKQMQFLLKLFVKKRYCDCKDIDPCMSYNFTELLKQQAGQEYVCVCE